MKLPYDVKQQGETYRFHSDFGIYYSIEFTDGGIYFFDLPVHIPIYEFSIKVLHLGGHLSPPKDDRIEITIVSILTRFFEDNTNSLIYVCDNLDKKQHARHRKFSRWFNNHTIAQLQKYDTYFVVEEIEILASLILHEENPFKNELIELFIGQSDNYIDK